MRWRRIGSDSAATFVAVSSVGTLSFFVFAAAVGSKAFDWAVMSNAPQARFCDYFMHIVFVSNPEHLYERATGTAGCFPPLAYMLYYFLYRITAAPGKRLANLPDAEAQNYMLFVFVCYSIVVSVLLLIAIRQWIRDDKKCLRVYVCVMFSAPFFFGAVERGNSTLLVVSLLLMALRLRDSESALDREAALLLIAVSTAMKLYPAVFAFLYIKERRLFEGIRLAVYALALLLLPFGLFGGIHAIRLWLSNILSTMELHEVGRIQYIKGLTITISKVAACNTSTGFAVFCQFVFLGFMIVLGMTSEDRTRAIVFLTSTMVFFPVNAYRYTLCYLAIPLVIRLSCPADGNCCGLIEMALYGTVFTIPTFRGAITGFRLARSSNITLTYVEMFIYGSAYILLLLEVIQELRARCRKHMATEEAQ